MHTRRAALLATTALALPLMFAGCAAEPQGAPVPVVTAPESSAPEPIAGAPGDPLTADEAKQLNGQRGTLRPYEMADGSFIIIDVKQPLPEQVVQEVVAGISASSDSDLSSYFNAMDQQEAATGKTLIVVRQIHHGTLSGEQVFGWTAASNATGFPGFDGTSSEDVAARAQAWATEYRDPAQLQLIVIPN